MPPRKRPATIPAGGPENIHPELHRLVVPIGSLSPFHKNPRRGDLPLLRESLRANGQYRPVVVNVGTHTGRSNEILGGNHTFAAAKAEGWSVIAATFVDVDEDR